jgi:hypothetical protein
MPGTSPAYAMIDQNGNFLMVLAIGGGSDRGNLNLEGRLATGSMKGWWSQEFLSGGPTGRFVLTGVTL